MGTGLYWTRKVLLPCVKRTLKYEHAARIEVSAIMLAVVSEEICRFYEGWWEGRGASSTVRLLSTQT